MTLDPSQLYKNEQKTSFDDDDHKKVIKSCKKGFWRKRFVGLCSLLSSACVTCLFCRVWVVRTSKNGKMCFSLFFFYDFFKFKKKKKKKRTTKRCESQNMCFILNLSLAPPTLKKKIRKRSL